MAKLPENLIRTTAFLRAYGDRLNGDIAALAEEMYLRLDEKMTAAPDEKDIDALLKEDIRIRPHYFKPAPLNIPREELEAAFGDAGTDASRLTKQGELVNQYLDDPEPGKPPKSSALEAAAARWGAKVGSPKPGRDPDATPEEKAKKEAARDSFGIEPSKNPFSPAWRAPRAPRSPEDREEQRRAACAHLFKTFGAAKSAKMAAAFGKQIDGSPLRPTGAAAIAARKAGAR